MPSQVFKQAFTDASSVVVNHNTNDLYVQVRLVVDSQIQNELIESVTSDPADPRNTITVNMTSVLSGIIQLVTTSEAVCSAVEPPGSSSSSSLSASTSRSSKEKVEHRFTTTGASDRHFILYDAVLETTSSNGQLRVELMLDGSQVLATMDSKPGGRGKQIKFSGHIGGDAYGAGVHTLALTYKKISGSGSVKISDAKITTWRVI